MANVASKGVAQTACLVMGVVFVVIAIWGFVDGQKVLIFHVNTVHNAVHLLSGLGALACCMAGERISRIFCFAFGLVYGLVAALGLMKLAFVVDLLHLNDADNWLHVAIAAAFVLAGFVSMSPKGARG